MLITLDKDFGDMVTVRGIRHFEIVRLVGFSAREHGPVSVSVLARYGEELTSGAMVTASHTRVRIGSVGPGGGES